jgi:hypothetical protein
MVEVKSKPGEEIVREGMGYLPFEDWGDYQDLIEEYEVSLKKRQKACEMVLSNFDRARDNDRIMDWECLRAEFPDIKISSDRDNVFLVIPKRIIKFLPSPESYTRVRRKLNAAGKFLPISYSTMVRRMRRQKAIRKYFSDQKWKKEEIQAIKLGSNLVTF